MTEKKTDNSVKTLLHIYASMVAILCLQFVPITEIQIASLFLVTALIISLYVIRSRNEYGSLLENHTSYLIKTFWVGGLFFSIGLIIAYIIFYYLGDHSYLYSFVDKYNNGIYGLDISLLEQEYQRVMTNYLTDNKSIIIKIFAITISPSLIYMIYRIGKGLARATKGYVVSNRKTWF